MGQVEQYRLDDIARRRLHELEYRGSVSRDAEEELVPKQQWMVNYGKVLGLMKVSPRDESVFVQVNDSSIVPPCLC